MTETWKLSIKPDSKSGLDALTLCRGKGIIGIGWHHCYRENDGDIEMPQSAMDAWNVIEAFWEENGRQYVPHVFLFELSPGDFVWIHQGGDYWLCKIGEGLLFGNEIDVDYHRYDLGHARPAQWVKVEEDLITGSILRGCIAPKTLQRISVTEQEQRAYANLFDRRLDNPAWRPVWSSEHFDFWLNPERNADFVSLMTPDDLEDIVCFHLQEQGWAIRKSSCYRSHPEFEFQMVHRTTGRPGFVQVKSGNSWLDRSKYVRKLQEGDVFLVAGGGVGGEAVKGIKTLEISKLLTWAKANPWAIGKSLYARMALMQCPA